MKYISIIILLLATSSFASASNFIGQERDWHIGGKIYFEEKSGPDFIGTREINKVVKAILNETFHIISDRCDSNAKIMLLKENGIIKMTHYTEKNRPGIGEELHSTLLYTKPRGFYDSETLHQVCPSLFNECSKPPTLEEVVATYNKIIQPDWKFRISKIVFTKNQNGSAFIIAELIHEGKTRIYKNHNPISAGLHMTLVNFLDSSIVTDQKELIYRLNKILKGKMIQITTKKGIIDLEFGISGSQVRIRAGEILRLAK